MRLELFVRFETSELFFLTSWSIILRCFCFSVAMRRLQDMGASYFVLDLRDNLGGLVQVYLSIKDAYTFSLILDIHPYATF